MAKPKRRGAKQRKRAGGHPARRGMSQEQREFEAAAETIRRRANEAYSPDTPPQRVVEIIVEDFDGLATPVGLTEALSERVSVEHTRAVLAAVLDRAPGTVTALALAAEASRMLDGDLVRARELLDHALEISTADSDATLAEHLLEAGEPAITAELLDEALAEDPEDETHHALYAQALEAIHARTPPGRRLRSEERAALERFADRSLLYRLRDEL